MMVNNIEVIIKTHWVNGWFIHLLGKPFVLVDGVEYGADFSRFIHIVTEKNQVEIGAGIRYKNNGSLLGYQPQVLTFNSSSHTVRCVFKNGPWNHSPFRIISQKIQ